MTTTHTPAPTPLDHAEEEAILARLSHADAHRFAKMNRAPWRWFISDATYAARLRAADPERRAQARYYAMVSRVTTYAGPDYRIRFPGQTTWVRANKHQYEQAGNNGVSRAMWGEGVAA